MSSVHQAASPEEIDLELPPFPVRRWTVEEYLLLAKLGVLDEDDNIELLEGWIVPKMTKNPLHDSTIDQVDCTVSPLLPGGWYFRIQNSFVTPTSVPEPDLCLVRGTPKDYSLRHPRGEDAALVVEVADSSLERDRLKRRTYARAGVPVYWIVNVLDNQVEVYSEIVGHGRKAVYGRERFLTSADKITLTVPGHDALELSVSALFP